MSNVSRHSFLKSLTGFAALSLLPKNLISSPNDSIKNQSIGELIKVVHLTDVHIENNPIAEKAFATCLNSINESKPDFIINGGDSIMNAAFTFSKDKVNSQWKLFKDILNKENNVSVKHCIGNHDLYGSWPLTSKDELGRKHKAMDEYGMTKPYYSFVHGKWKFIVLDSIQLTSSIPGYYAKLNEEQMEWLERELTDTKDLFVCIVSHVPILSVCSLFDGGILGSEKMDKTLSNSKLHSDSAELTRMFYKHGNVKVCLSGHIHLIDHVNYLGVDYYCNGAVSGSWWKGNHHEFPPAYSVMSFGDDGKVSREVKYYNWK